MISPQTGQTSTVTNRVKDDLVPYATLRTEDEDEIHIACDEVLTNLSQLGKKIECHSFGPRVLPASRFETLSSIQRKRKGVPPLFNGNFDMASDLTIANAVLAWLHGIRGESAATRYLEAEFGAILGAAGITSSMLSAALVSAVAASPYADLETREDYLKFFKAAESKGFFKGTTEGSPEYAARLAKLVDKFRANAGLAAPTPAVAAVPVPANANAAAAVVNDEVGAEAAKLAGNKAVEAGQHRRAVELYTDAIVCAPTGKSSHVYYANRAAAKLAMKDYEGAAEDARSAVAADDSYAKGWSRLGGALVELEQYVEAVDSYDKCLVLDPSNKVAIHGLADAKSRQRSALRVANAPPRSSQAVPASANPLAGLMASMGGGGGGGMPAMPPGMDMSKMAGLMADPELAAAMNDPEMMPIIMAMQRDGPMAIMQHMGNPKVMALASKMMKSMGMGGGM